MLSREIRTHKPKYRATHRNPHSENSQIESQFTRNPKNIRVVQSNLVYVIGLRPGICTEDILAGKDFFGKYGKVSKVIINKKGSSNRKCYRDISYAAHITYDDEVSASLAVVSLFEFKHHENTIRSCYGYTKYCQSFFYGRDCYKNDCVYLHQFQSEQEIMAGQGCDKQMERQNFQKQLSLALRIIYQNRKQVVQNCRQQKQSSAQFPDAYDSMKALIAYRYLTQEQYQRQWEVEDTLKCYTESTETSPMKQELSDQQKPQNEEEVQNQIDHEPQPQRQRQQSKKVQQQNQQHQSGGAVVSNEQIGQMISTSILRIVRDESMKVVTQIGIANPNSSSQAKDPVKPKSRESCSRKSCSSKVDSHQSKQQGLISKYGISFNLLLEHIDSNSS